MTTRTTALRHVALAVVAVASLAACGNGSATDTGNSASAGASNAASAASAAASNASTAATDAASAASTAATNGASSASSAASTAAAGASTAANKAAGMYTMADVAKHATETDCWTAIKGPEAKDTGVYDLTKWIAKHPGGKTPIVGLCGKDGTTGFIGKHGEDGPNGEPEKALATFRVGTLHA